MLKIRIKGTAVLQISIEVLTEISTKDKKYLTKNIG